MKRAHRRRVGGLATCAAGILLAVFAGGRAAAAPPAPPGSPEPATQRAPRVERCTSTAMSAEMTAAAAAVPAGPDLGVRRSEAWRNAFRTRAEACMTERLAWSTGAWSGPAAWARARGDAATFFESLRRGGTLIGSSADKAYFARCDLTTMTEADIDAGAIVCAFGGATRAPAEFEVGTVRVTTRGRDPSYVPLPRFDAAAARARWSSCAAAVRPPRIATASALDAFYTRLLPCIAEAERAPSTPRTWTLLERALSFVGGEEAAAGRVEAGTARMLARCDATTTTQAEREAGTSVCVFGYTPKIGTKGAAPELRLVRLEVPEKGPIRATAML